MNSVHLMEAYTVDGVLPAAVSAWIWPGGRGNVFRGAALMFAGTQTASSAKRLEAFLPLLPQTLNTPAMPESKEVVQFHQKITHLTIKNSMK